MRSAVPESLRDDEKLRGALADLPHYDAAREGAVLRATLPFADPHGVHAHHVAGIVFELDNDTGKNLLGGWMREAVSLQTFWSRIGPGADKPRLVLSRHVLPISGAADATTLEFGGRITVPSEPGRYRLIGFLRSRSIGGQNLTSPDTREKRLLDVVVVE